MKQFLKSQIKLAIATLVIAFSISVCVFLFLAFLFGFLTADDTPPQLSYKTTYGNYASTNKFLAIPITGVIVGSSNEVGTDIFSTLNNTAGYDVEEELHEAAQDTSIKGIILEINSPGGELSGAHAIADGVTEYKVKTKKPVIAFISGLGTSGAYWAAISTDDVFADYGSEIGDIGVISGPFAYYDKVTAENNGILDGGVVTQNGIQETYIYAGQSKDLGNPYRQMTAGEIAVLQQAVDNEYTLFVNYVSQRRHIATDMLRNTIQALPYGDAQAQLFHLIDGIKGRQATYTFLARKLGIANGDFKIISAQPSKSLISSLLQSMGKVPQPRVSTFCSSTGILSYYGNVQKLCE